MATAPKTIVKSSAKNAPTAAPAAEGGAGVKKSPKKLIIMIVIGVLVLAIGAAAAMLLLNKKKDGKDTAKAAASASEHAEIKPPVFLPLEPFTVNLMSEGGDQFLQATFTLQLADQHQVDNLKAYTPQIRSRLLILLSGKKASDISSVEGKQKLSEEIMELVREPFAHGGPKQEVGAVFITSFVIQ